MAIRRTSSRTPLLQSKVFRESLVISMMFVALLLLLMLFSYNPTDTSGFSASGKSTFTNLAGRLGADIAANLYYWLGYTSFLLPIFLIIYSVGMLTATPHPLYLKIIKRLSGLLLMLSLGGLLSLHSNIESNLPATLGGYIGLIIASESHSLLGIWGANLFLLLLVVVSVSLFSGLSWLGILELVGGLALLMFSKIITQMKPLSKSQPSPHHNPLDNPLDNPQPSPSISPEKKSVFPVRNILDVLTKRSKPLTGKGGNIEPKFVFMPGQSDIAGKLEESDKLKMSEQQISEQQMTAKPIAQQLGQGSDQGSSQELNHGLGEGTETIPRVPPKTSPTNQSTTEATKTYAKPSPSTSPSPADSSLPTSVNQLQLPTSELLAKAPPQDSGIDEASLLNLGETLVKTLKDFGIEVKLLGHSPGPVVTMFEVEPAAGIKSSRISNLASDLSRSLAVGSVRVVEFISGKSCIGIEVPNPNRQLVNFRQLIESPQFKDPKLLLPLVLGQDIGGKPVVADLAAMPHLLVAGTTGSGKSIGINSMLISLLCRYTPQQLRLILVDPKMLELASYNDIPNLLTPVITDMALAGKSIGWCVNEMDRRYKIMADAGVRNIESYNEKLSSATATSSSGSATNSAPNPADGAPRDATENTTPDDNTPLPYIVIVIDEYADMIMVNRKVEDHLVRLAQKARASGIHIVLATQRPSVDVITGLIKANVPARISFKVSSRIDSRTILDASGAEQLLGKGDMLYMGSGGEMAKRVHGAFVTDEDIHKVTDHCRQQGSPEYHNEVLAAAAAGEKPTNNDGGGGEEKDEFYAAAVEFVRESERVSISSVQRKFKVGYNRAARIIEFMEEEGLVSSMDNAGKRTVLS